MALFFLIQDTLVSATQKECCQHKYPYVALVTAEEFNTIPGVFDMGIDMNPDFEHQDVTKIEVNYDSLTGAFRLFNRNDIFGPPGRVAFALDEKGIAFINDDGTAEAIIAQIAASRKWRAPSLERFLYDFLEQIVSEDLKLFEEYDKRMDELEDRILTGDTDKILREVTDLRGEILEIHTHYEQLLDLSQELQENENGFFRPENLRYFDMYTNRIMRLRDLVKSLRERVIQVRELYDTQLEIKQNKISTLLTIVATIFMPLTLIAGWYGMNFRYMPELNSLYGYPVIIGISVAIVFGSILFFKKKKWF
ncbi:MAG: magnesium transporter CorA [Oscillospiraceae bacterium]|nr:magnesium transporter CorA [Oscillospiraceae bacterium]